MTSSDNPFSVEKPVSVIDLFNVIPGKIDEVLNLIRRDYQPQAEQRGLALQRIHCLPPLAQAGQSSDLVLEWQYANLGAMWQARQEEQSDTINEIWQRLSPLLLSRRRLLGRDEIFQPAADNTLLSCEKPASTGARYIAYVQRDPVFGPADVLPMNSLAARQKGITHSDAGFNKDPYCFRPGQLTWSFCSATTPDWSGLQDLLPAKSTLTEWLQIGECLDCGVREADFSHAIKRTILLKTIDGVSDDLIASMEADLMQFPRLLPAISSWRISRVAQGSGATSWTHCFEQEFSDPGELYNSYLNHPFHWAVVDRYFHREAHQFCADAFSQTIRPTDHSVLQSLLD